MTLRIDPATGDLSIDDAGILETIDGDQTTAQAVWLTLRAWKGEWELDPSHGTDHERVMGKKPHELEDDEIEEVLRDGILQESGVSEIRTLTVERTGRELAVNFAARLASGATINMEEVIQG